MWVRTNLGNGAGVAAQPSLAKNSEDEPAAGARDDVADVPMLDRLNENSTAAPSHTAGIKVVGLDKSSAHELLRLRALPKTANRADASREEGAIAGLAQYYTSYLRKISQQGMHPDLVELINEPNLGQNGKYRPPELAQLVSNVEKDLADAHVVVGLSALGNGGPHFPLCALCPKRCRDRGGLAGLKAISIHTYYVRDKVDGPTVPPADDADFQSLVTAARGQNLPLISTEFGGTDVKMKRIDPSKEAVDAAEELKAALDLVRAGRIRRHRLEPLSQPQLQRDAVHMGADRRERAYKCVLAVLHFIFRKVPVGSDVLAVEHSDITAAFTAQPVTPRFEAETTSMSDCQTLPRIPQ